MSEQTEQNKNLDKEGLTLVLMRNAFYRDNYRSAVFAVVFVFFINILLLITIVYRYTHPPEPQYFATNGQYQLIKWHPLTDPVRDNNYVLQWTSNAVQEAFSLDFIHWRSQLQRAQNNFTPSGWNWFVTAFKKSGDLQSLVNLSMVSDAVVTGAPQIQYQGVLDGTYLWKIKMPVMITYANSTGKTIRVPMKVTLIVQRVSVQDNPSLIEINQFLPEVQSTE